MTSDQYDRRLFERLMADFRAGAFRSDAASSDAAAYAPVPAEEIDELPKPGSPDHQACSQLGREALSRGQVAQVILAGGAGTRFGGMVKGLVPVFKGYSFLDLKLEAARAVGHSEGRAVTSALMTSDLTEHPIAEHLRNAGPKNPCCAFGNRCSHASRRPVRSIETTKGAFRSRPRGMGIFIAPSARPASARSSLPTAFGTYFSRTWITSGQRWTQSRLAFMFFAARR